MEPFSKGLGLLGQSPPDFRDHLYAHTPQQVYEAPPFVDLRTMVNAKGFKATPRIFDQGQLGSCTANATAALVQYVEHKDGDPDWDRLSRLYIYYYTRDLEGTVQQDAGGLIRDALKVVGTRGAPREKFWPYDINKFAETPTGFGEWRAGEHRALDYQSVEDGNEDAMVACLAEGYPFVYGFAVYRSFWGIGDDGQWDGARGTIDGYHAVDAWGYDFRPGAFGFPEGGWIVRNSWAEDWGDEGWFYVPRSYMEDEAFDCWTVRKVKK